tara:strand:+ start:678 stop:887 length:210 start_codon:yes stop_codon:yes gene_type:complete
MSKIKNWLWDEAEKALDELETKVKNGESVSSVLEYAKTLQVDWSFVGFSWHDSEQEAWDEIESYLYANA